MFTTQSRTFAARLQWSNVALQIPDSLPNKYRKCFRWELNPVPHGSEPTILNHHTTAAPKMYHVVFRSIWRFRKQDATKNFKSDKRQRNSSFTINLEEHIHDSQENIQKSNIMAQSENNSKLAVSTTIKHRIRISTSYRMPFTMINKSCTKHIIISVPIILSINGKNNCINMLKVIMY